MSGPPQNTTDWNQEKRKDNDQRNEYDDACVYAFVH